MVERKVLGNITLPPREFNYLYLCTGMNKFKINEEIRIHEASEHRRMHTHVYIYIYTNVYSRLLLDSAQHSTTTCRLIHTRRRFVRVYGVCVCVAFLFLKENLFLLEIPHNFMRKWNARAKNNIASAANKKLPSTLKYFPLVV